MKKFKLKLKFKIPALSVRGRLYGVVGMLAVMLIAGAAIGLGALHFQNEGMRRIYEEEVVPTEMLARINQSSLMSFVVLGEAAAKVGSPDQVKQMVAEFQKYQEEMSKAKAEFLKVPMSEDVKKLYDKWQSTNSDYDQAKSDMIDALNQGDQGASDVLELQVRPLLMDRQSHLGALIKMKGEEASTIYATESSQYKMIRAICIGALSTGLVLSLLIAMLVVRSILSTLAHTVSVAHLIAEGKLGHDIQVTRNV
jgi:methyl-accepting chemotaxis protein